MYKSILQLALWTAVATGPCWADADTGSQERPNSRSQPQYVVKDGNKVDSRTLEGWKTWRALACERCHGAAGEGMVGPSLLISLKSLSKEDFHTVMMKGRVAKGMPNYDGSAMMQKNWEGLYAYLKGLSDGQIKPGHLSPLDAR